MITNWKKIQRIALHVCFWTLYLFFYSFLYGYRTKAIGAAMLQSSYTLPLDIATTYFAIYFLIPNFLLKRKYFLYFLFLIISTIIASAITRLINYYYVIPHFSPNYDLSKYPVFNFGFLIQTYNIYPVVILASAIKLLKSLFEERYKRMELEIQNQSSELALLRNQINPHFLFNTLNNIHTLITKDSNKAGDALLRLSEIMRYMLYETSVDLVPMEKEVEYIQSYIDLQKLRLTHPHNINLTLEGNMKGHLIAPMIFIPFIENTFKHFDKNNKTDPILISLQYNNGKINFISSNPIKKKHEETLDKIGGIGLKNVKRRLELIYPNKYNLDISKNNSIYSVKLTINLHDN